MAYSANYHDDHGPGHMLDDSMDTYWMPSLENGKAEAIIDLGDQVTFNLMILGENIRCGQKVKSFAVQGLIGNEWVPLAEGTTIGYKRILRIENTKTSRIKLIITDATDNYPMIASVALSAER